MFFDELDPRTSLAFLDRTLLGSLDRELARLTSRDPENQCRLFIKDSIRENLGCGVQQTLRAEGEVRHDNLRLMPIQANSAGIFRDSQDTRRGINLQMERLVRRDGSV
jgi:hypothetical protein